MVIFPSKSSYLVWFQFMYFMRQCTILAVPSGCHEETGNLHARARSTSLQTFEVKFSRAHDRPGDERPLDFSSRRLQTSAGSECILHFTNDLGSFYVTAMGPFNDSLSGLSKFYALCGRQFLFSVKSLNNSTILAYSNSNIAITQFVDSISSLEKYAASMLNRQVYAEKHMYHLWIGIGNGALSSAPSFMFGKPLVLLKTFHRTKVKIICNLDMDGWFVSFQDFDHFFQFWSHRDFIFVPSTGQAWLNTGFLCFRRLPKSFTFLRNWYDLRNLFRGRPADQPAFWYTLLLLWHKKNEIKLPSRKQCESCAWNLTGPYHECLHICLRPVERLNNFRMDQPQRKGLPYLTVHRPKPYECKMHSLLPSKECSKSNVICPFRNMKHMTLRRQEYYNTLFFHTGAKNWFNFSTIILLDTNLCGEGLYGKRFLQVL